MLIENNKIIIDIPKFEFIKTPHGYFEMGNGKYKHWVYLNKDFEISQYCVKSKLYSIVTNEFIKMYSDWDNTKTNTHMYDCQKFINNLNSVDSTYNYRLPTEAEWEYVATALPQKYKFIPTGKFEWCQDWYSRSYRQSNLKMIFNPIPMVVNPIGPKKRSTGIVVKAYNNPTERYNFGIYDYHGVSFRLVRSLKNANSNI